MKNKHRIKQGLSLLLAGGIALTNLGAALPAFAEDAPATPETAEATTPETAETNVPTPNLSQITENLYADLPDAPTGSYLGSMGLPVATGETKIGISAWVSDLYDGVDAHMDADALNADENTVTIGKTPGTDYAIVPLLAQVEYPADGAVSEIILPDDVELLSYLSTDYEPIPADEQEQTEILHQTYSEQSAAATGLYVKASADFTAQLVYTDSDGSSQSKAIHVQISEDAAPTQMYADTGDDSIAVYAAGPTPPYATGKITSIAKEGGTWLIWFNGQEAYCCSHGLNGQPKGCPTYSFSHVSRLEPGQYTPGNHYANQVNIWGGLGQLSLDMLDDRPVVASLEDDPAGGEEQPDILGSLYDETQQWIMENYPDSYAAQTYNAVKNLLQTIDAERLFQRPPLLSMGKEIAAGVTDTEQKVEQIILEVTEQCNFRCKYCVYSEDFSGNRDFGNRRMPTEIAFKAIDWALENSGAKLAITFYGGEPLLNFKLMKAVIERSQAKRGNKEIVYSFTSNMSLMTREIATYLAQVPNLYIMASIDGPRTVHDAYRVYANDAPTFEDSIGGLRILADAYAGSHMPVNINAVLTPPFGFEKLEQVNAYFESLDWLPATCHVNITYPSYGTCPGLDEYYDKITGNPKYALHGMCNPLMIWQQRKAETDGLDAYKARNIYYHSIFDDLVKINNRIIVDEPTLRRGLNGCCVPGKKRLYVTATGEYKACERIGSSPSIGNVDEGVDRELIVKKYVEEFAAQSKDICDKCWAYNLCRVCYAGVCNENGLDMGLKNEACRASRSVALNNLALYHELMEENPEALNCLKDAVIE